MYGAIGRLTAEEYRRDMYNQQMSFMAERNRPMIGPNGRYPKMQIRGNRHWFARRVVRKGKPQGPVGNGWSWVARRGAW